MKKLFVLLLCLTVCIVPVLVACNSGTVTDTSSAVSDSQGDVSDADESKETEIPGYNPETGKYEPNLPEYKWEEDKEFKVLVYSNEVQTTYFSEDVEPDLYETTDEALNEAVRERNNQLSEKYKNVKIKAYKVADAAATLAQEIQAPTVGYDAAMPFLSSAVSMAQSKAFYNLAEFDEYIDLSMPWWDQNFLDVMTINDKVYFAIGDISIMQKIVSGAVVYNKENLASIAPDVNIYQEVRDYEWTFDRMVELAKLYTKDNDGEQGMSYKDCWGISGSYSLPLSYYMSSGEHFVTKGADGNPYIAFDTDRSITVAQKILTTFAEQGTWILYSNEIVGSNKDIWTASLDIFGENRALFYNCAFSAIKKLRNYTDLDEWGFLPRPLLDSTQDTYYTPCSARSAYGIVIPTSAPDPEFSAFMIEAMCAEAKNYITPAYYETILKGRDTKDEDSEEMLDKYIFANIGYDLGVTYNLGSISEMFSTLAGAHSADIVSQFDAQRDVIQTAIDNLIAAYSD